MVPELSPSVLIEVLNDALVLADFGENPAERPVPPSFEHSDAPDEHFGGSEGIADRRVADRVLDIDAEAFGQRVERVRRRPSEENRGEEDRVENGMVEDEPDPRSVALEEGEIEGRVVRDEDRPGREGVKAPGRLLDARRGRDHVVADPVDLRGSGRDRAIGVDEDIEALALDDPAVDDAN